jgi:hypothetical protein
MRRRLTPPTKFNRILTGTGVVLLSPCSIMRADQSRVTRMRKPEKLTIVLGLITAAMGAFYVVTASGIVVLGPERPHEDPRWVGVLVGLIFLLGGAAVTMRGFVGGNEQDPDGLPVEKPRWLRAISHLMALLIVLSFGAVFSWIGFGPGERTFSGSGAVLGPTAGRAAFGFGACLIWLGLGVMAASRLRRLFGRG